MAERIVCSEAEFQTCIAAYKGSLEQLQSAVSIYEEALNALNSDWTGKAFVIMMGKVVSMIKNIKQSFDRVTDAVNELEAVDKLFAEHETTLTGKFNTLDAGRKSSFGG